MYQNVPFATPTFTVAYYHISASVERYNVWGTGSEIITTGILVRLSGIILLSIADNFSLIK
jgi:hypothetical protein